MKKEKVMSKQEQEEEFEYDADPLVSFNPQALSPPPGKPWAVFEDKEGDLNVLPVLLFACGPFRTQNNDRGTLVVGMISMNGGLEAAENMEEMSLVGYWQEDQQSIEEFLRDHGIDLPPEAGDEEGEDS